MGLLIIHSSHHITHHITLTHHSSHHITSLITSHHSSHNIHQHRQHGLHRQGAEHAQRADGIGGGDQRAEDQALGDGETERVEEVKVEQTRHHQAYKR